MIIWLASYPKSGNTLVRSLLSAYFFSEVGTFSFDLLKNIQQFPQKKLFDRVGVNTKSEIEVIKNYIKVQESFNKKNSIQFIKTHSCLFNINGNPFTNLNNSLGAIYIVRDPRTVVLSYANHTNKDVASMKDHLINGLKIGGNNTSNYDDDALPVYTGNWGKNYESWKSFKNTNQYLLIKYEDLIKKKEETFLSILRFIFGLQKKVIKIDQKKFKEVLESTRFEKMKSLEDTYGFPETKKNKFFNLGPNNNWKKVLDKKHQIEIENSFKREMRELGYLNN